MKDEDFMRLAIEEAKKSDYPFGALIVKDNKIISRAGTIKKNSLDPTAHADITAIREACKKLNSRELTNATLYATCEPCPMCFTAAWLAGINKIVYGMSLEDSSRALYPEIKVPSDYLNEKSGNKINIVKGILKEEILKLFKI